jgi:hypothetical protein
MSNNYPDNIGYYGNTTDPRSPHFEGEEEQEKDEDD